MAMLDIMTFDYSAIKPARAEQENEQRRRGQQDQQGRQAGGGICVLFCLYICLILLGNCCSPFLSSSPLLLGTTGCLALASKKQDRVLQSSVLDSDIPAIHHTQFFMYYLTYMVCFVLHTLQGMSGKLAHPSKLFL